MDDPDFVSLLTWGTSDCVPAAREPIQGLLDELMVGRERNRAKDTAAWMSRLWSRLVGTWESKRYIGTALKKETYRLLSQEFVIQYKGSDGSWTELEAEIQLDVMVPAVLAPTRASTATAAASAAPPGSAATAAAAAATRDLPRPNKRRRETEEESSSRASDDESLPDASEGSSEEELSSTESEQQTSATSDSASSRSSSTSSQSSSAADTTTRRRGAAASSSAADTTTGRRGAAASSSAADANTGRRGAAAAASSSAVVGTAISRAGAATSRGPGIVCRMRGWEMFLGPNADGSLWYVAVDTSTGSVSTFPRLCRVREAASIRVPRVPQKVHFWLQHLHTAGMMWVFYETATPEKCIGILTRFHTAMRGAAQPRADAAGHRYGVAAAAAPLEALGRSESGRVSGMRGEGPRPAPRLHTQMGRARVSYTLPVGSITGAPARTSSFQCVGSCSWVPGQNVRIKPGWLIYTGSHYMVVSHFGRPRTLLHITGSTGRGVLDSGGAIGYRVHELLSPGLASVVPREKPIRGLRALRNAKVRMFMGPPSVQMYAPFSSFNVDTAWAVWVLPVPFRGATPALQGPLPSAAPVWAEVGSTTGILMERGQELVPLRLDKTGTRHEPVTEGAVPAGLAKGGRVNCGLVDLDAYRTIHFLFPMTHREAYSMAPVYRALWVHTVRPADRMLWVSWLLWNNIAPPAAADLFVALSDAELYPLAVTWVHNPGGVRFDQFCPAALRPAAAAELLKAWPAPAPSGLS